MPREAASYCEYLQDELRRTKEDNEWLRRQIDGRGVEAGGGAVDAGRALTREALQRAAPTPRSTYRATSSAEHSVSSPSRSTSVPRSVRSGYERPARRIVSTATASNTTTNTTRSYRYQRSSVVLANAGGARPWRPVVVPTPAQPVSRPRDVVPRYSQPHAARVAEKYIRLTVKNSWNNSIVRSVCFEAASNARAILAQIDPHLLDGGTDLGDIMVSLVRHGGGDTPHLSEQTLQQCGHTRLSDLGMQSGDEVAFSSRAFGGLDFHRSLSGSTSPQPRPPPMGRMRLSSLLKVAVKDELSGSYRSMIFDKGLRIEEFLLKVNSVVVERVRASRGKGTPMSVPVHTPMPLPTPSTARSPAGVSGTSSSPASSCLSHTVKQHLRHSSLESIKGQLHQHVDGALPPIPEGCMLSALVVIVNPATQDVKDAVLYDGRTASRQGCDNVGTLSDLVVVDGNEVIISVDTEQILIERLASLCPPTERTHGSYEQAEPSPEALLCVPPLPSIVSMGHHATDSFDQSLLQADATNTSRGDSLSNDSASPQETTDHTSGSSPPQRPPQSRPARQETALHGIVHIDPPLEIIESASPFYESRQCDVRSRNESGVAGEWVGDNDLIIKGDARVGGVLEVEVYQDGVPLDELLLCGKLEWFCIKDEGEQGPEQGYLIDSNVLTYIPSIHDLDCSIEAIFVVDEYSEPYKVKTPPIRDIPAVKNAHLQGKSHISCSLSVHYEIIGGDSDVDITWSVLLPQTGGGGGSFQLLQTLESHGKKLFLTKEMEGCVIRCTITPILKKNKTRGDGCEVFMATPVRTNRPSITGLELVYGDDLSPGATVQAAAQVETLDGTVLKTKVVGEGGSQRIDLNGSHAHAPSLRSSGKYLLMEMFDDDDTTRSGTFGSDSEDGGRHVDSTVMPIVTWSIGDVLQEEKGASYVIKVGDMGKRLDCTFQVRVLDDLYSDVATAALFIPILEEETAKFNIPVSYPLCTLKVNIERKVEKKGKGEGGDSFYSYTKMLLTTAAMLKKCAEKVNHGFGPCASPTSSYSAGRRRQRLGGSANLSTRSQTEDGTDRDCISDPLVPHTMTGDLQSDPHNTAVIPTTDDVGHFVKCSVQGTLHNECFSYVSLQRHIAAEVASTIETTGVRGFNVWSKPKKRKRKRKKTESMGSSGKLLSGSLSQGKGEKHHLILTNKYIKIMKSADRAVLSKKKWSKYMGVARFDSAGERRSQVERVFMSSLSGGYVSEEDDEEGDDDDDAGDDEEDDDDVDESDTAHSGEGTTRFSFTITIEPRVSFSFYTTSEAERESILLYFRVCICVWGYFAGGGNIYTKQTTNNKQHPSGLPRSRHANTVSRGLQREGRPPRRVQTTREMGAGTEPVRAVPQCGMWGRFFWGSFCLFGFSWAGT